MTTAKLRIRHLDGFLVLEFLDPNTDAKEIHLRFYNQDDLIKAMIRLGFSEEHTAQVAALTQSGVVIFNEVFQLRTEQMRELTELSFASVRSSEVRGTSHIV